MILAGLVLVALGAADLVRLLPGRTGRALLWSAAAIVLLVGAAALDAAAWGAVAVVVAVAWVTTMCRDGAGRAGLWPVAAVAALVTIAVAVAAPREDVEVFGGAVVIPSVVGGTPIDLAILVAGCVLFLAESSNIAVRAALREEAGRAAVLGTGLKGGRLIGPLERLLVFALTAAGAYTLLAAILAAKGIVRFPEISRDSGEGNRAEYFLVGSLVSWTLGVAAAFLVGWGLAPR